MKKTSSPLAAFFGFIALTFFLSWIFWIPAAVLQQPQSTFPTALLHILGGFGPSIAGLVLVFRRYDGSTRRDFWRRAFSFHNLGLGWTLVSLLLLPLTFILSMVPAVLVSSTVPTFPTLKAIAASPIELLPLIIIGIVAGPLSEELGWRGYGLDVLRQRFGAFGIIAILGAFWAVWHLPLFFILGTSQNQMGVGSTEFWLFIINAFSLTAIFLWVYQRTRSSVLSAILLHFSYNFTFSLFFPLPTIVSLFHSGIMILLAAGLWLLSAPRAVKNEAAAQ